MLPPSGTPVSCDHLLLSGRPPPPTAPLVTRQDGDSTACRGNRRAGGDSDSFRSCATLPLLLMGMKEGAGPADPQSCLSTSCALVDRAGGLRPRVVGESARAGSGSRAHQIATCKVQPAQHRPCRRPGRGGLGADPRLDAVRRSGGREEGGAPNRGVGGPLAPRRGVHPWRRSALLLARRIPRVNAASASKALTAATAAAGSWCKRLSIHASGLVCIAHSGGRV